MHLPARVLHELHASRDADTHDRLQVVIRVLEGPLPSSHILDAPTEFYICNRELISKILPSVLEGSSKTTSKNAYEQYVRLHRETSQKAVEARQRMWRKDISYDQYKKEMAQLDLIRKQKLNLASIVSSKPLRAALELASKQQCKLELNLYQQHRRHHRHRHQQ